MAVKRKHTSFKKMAAFIVIIMMSIVLEGCWDEINLQDTIFITALGIDYKDNQFEVSGQSIKFGLIAKTESVQSDPNPVWIGKGSGRTVLLAIDNLTRAGQKILSLDHLKTVVVHERAMNKMNDIMDGLNRQRASRYTSLIFGTRAPIEKLLTSDTFFDQSQLNSVMYTPYPLDNQRSFIKPHALQLAVQTMNEPAIPTTLPALTANSDFWKRKEQKLEIQLIEGIFVFQDHNFQGFLTEKEATGLRWVNADFKQFLLEAEGQQGRSAIAIRNVDARMNMNIKEDKPIFRLNMQLSGNVAELNGDMDKVEIVKVVEGRVKKEIEDTYRKGLARGMDLFKLEHHLYRYHHSYWKENCKGKDWLPQLNQLNVEVDFRINHTGNFDLNEDTYLKETK